MEKELHKPPLLRYMELLFEEFCYLFTSEGRGNVLNLKL